MQRQREGRAGRVKRGCSTRFVVTGFEKEIPSIPMPLSSLQYVVAVETYHYKIFSESLTLCPVLQDRVQTARQQISVLALSPDDLWTAVSSVPFSLRDAAVFFSSRNWHVGYEVTAVLVFKNICTWKPSVRLRLHQVVAALSS